MTGRHTLAPALRAPVIAALGLLKISGGLRIGFGLFSGYVCHVRTMAPGL
jgi:hypothetical protein